MIILFLIVFKVQKGKSMRHGAVRPPEGATVTFSFPLRPAAPTIEFEQASYQVREPPGPDGVEVLDVKVVRGGDLDRTSKVRCSTRDGSAQSGVDYNPKSRVLKFPPGQFG